jgi:hypothetical protein
MTTAPRLATSLLLSLLVGSFASPAAATIRKVPGAWLWGPRSVWTDGSANPMFHPFSDAIDTGSVTFARVTIEMDQDTGFCKIRPALRYSSDGINWDAPAAISATYRTSIGIDYGTVWVDLTALATAKNWVQFGVEAANDSGSALNLCNASLMVQPRDRN